MENSASHNSTRSSANYSHLLLIRRAETLLALGLNCKRLAGLAGEKGADPKIIEEKEYLWGRVNRVLSIRLQIVDEALERLEKGGFGICLECRAVIGATRLQAAPWARYCANCVEVNSMEALKETIQA